MITRDYDEFLEACLNGRFPADSAATPLGVFMVEPLDFQLLAESASDNRYMNLEHVVDTDRAMEQYVRLVSMIRETGVAVKSFIGNAKTPDDIFPNNVFATIPGRLIVGHMLHPSRQLETARQDIREFFQSAGYELVDLSVEDCVAELTGVLIIDRARRIGFCGMSRRVDEAGVSAMHKAFDLRATLQFDLDESEYHTNVILSILASRACVIHDQSVKGAGLSRVLAAVYHGQVLHLDDAEKAAFAGNCIALTNNDLFMSQAAADALRLSSRQLLESWGFRIHSCPLDEIEKAGGSLRCMVAEIF
ncbi:MAG TPA: arginine deiminase-related protein [Xanthomonadales bacterium]|nr:arginine deiminase-related protein [Xanthomonadales bacterium]